MVNVFFHYQPKEMWQAAKKRKSALNRRPGISQSLPASVRASDYDMEFCHATSKSWDEFLLESQVYPIRLHREISQALSYQSGRSNRMHEILRAPLRPWAVLEMDMLLPRERYITYQRYRKASEPSPNERNQHGAGQSDSLHSTRQV